MRLLTPSKNTFSLLAPLTLVLLAALAMQPAQAQFSALSGLAKKDNTSAVDIDALLDEQDDLLGRFNLAFNNMLLAQSRTLEALGLKEDADLAASTAEAFASGNIQDEEQIERAIEVSNAAGEKISGAQAESAQLDQEARQHLVAAMPHYAKGTAESIKLPDAFSGWAGGITSGVSELTKNPLELRKLKSGTSTGLFVAKRLPALLANWRETTGNFMAYARGNDLDTSNLDSVIGDL